MNIQQKVWPKSEKFIVFTKSKIFDSLTNPEKKPTKLFVSSHLPSMRWASQSQDSGNHLSGYLMLLQNTPPALTLQINSHSPLQTPSLRSFRAHKLPSGASQPYLWCSRQWDAPTQGYQLHQHRPKLPGGCTPQPSPAPASASPAALQQKHTSLEAVQGKGVCPQDCWSVRKFLTQAGTDAYTPYQ